MEEKNQTDSNWISKIIELNKKKERKPLKKTNEQANNN